MTSQGYATTPTVQLTLIPAQALEALLAGALEQASEQLGLPLPPYFLDNRSLWRMRLDQIRASPESAPWLIRAVCGQPAGAVVGYAGFHGPPDARGMVEIGYSIAPHCRRLGYGRAAAAQLLDYAAAFAGVSVVRASISPDNIASLALIHSLGFKQTGEQWDDEDGLELVFERSSGPDPG